MTGPELIDIARDGLMTYARVAGPLMGVILLVGVIISFLQAVTQIQEQTLTFVPKMLIAGFALLVVFLGSFIERLTGDIAASLAQFGGG